MIGVFGATGFLGQHLLRKLVQLERKPLGASRFFDPEFTNEFSTKIEMARMDITKSLSASAALEGVETVVQLISTSSPGLQNRNMEEDIQANVIPHIRFIRNAMESGVKRYIFVSSGGTIYGKGHTAPISEDAPTLPLNSHGLTKLMVEQYIKMHGAVDDLDFTILRLANPFGPGQVYKNGQGLIPSILTRHANKKPITIFSQGAAARDFIYIEDVIEAIVSAIDATATRKATINIGSGRARTVLSVIEALESIMGVTFEKEHAGDRKTDVDVNVLDITRARDLLSWQPHTDFDIGLRRTVDAFYENQS